VRSFSDASERMESATFFYCGCDAVSTIRAAISFGMDMWTAVAGGITGRKSLRQVIHSEGVRRFGEAHGKPLELRGWPCGMTPATGRTGFSLGTIAAAAVPNGLMDT
jgi:hypothetical protein